MPVLVSSHIPKTGGTTFANLLRRTYGSHHIDLYYPPPMGRLEKKYYKDLAYYWRYKAKSFSSHNLFLEDTEDTYPELRFVVFLRDPIDRVCSYLMHLTRGAPHFWKSKPAPPPDTKAEIHTKRNRMIHFINGEEDYSSEENKLENAKKQLSQYHYIGITEKFNESVDVIRRDFPEICADFENKNTNPNKKNKSYKDLFSEEIYNFIISENKLDIELYRYGKELFDTRLNTAS